jgi:asparagine synthase (glutamine-hydrolysing)
MCGIAGVAFADRARPVEEGVLRAMGDSIAHRGPDAAGYWSAPGVGLVHRRLAIIDVAGGDQPIGNEDDTIQVVFNGEIYNFERLREWLEAKGHRFRTRSDTEVLVHLYEEHGPRLVERLRGMFAFAIWDRRQHLLVLGRDRLGLKPLYIYQDADKLLFGSELKAILAFPGVEREVDIRALDDYLTFGMVPGSRSILQDIAKLPPAHVLTLDTMSWRTNLRRYWTLEIAPDHRRSVSDWQEAIQSKIDETVRRHLMADVPVGAFLSGGLDSSIVVGSAAAAMPHALKTFSIGFEDESFSELPFARQIARQQRTEHTEEIVTADAAGLLGELTHYFDEPMADSSIIPTYLVSRLASRQVKVALSGDGGDEAFGGYGRYAHDLFEAGVRRALPRWFRRAALGTLARFWPRADWLPRPLRLKNALLNLSLEPGSAYANTLSIWRQPLRRSLLAPDLAAELTSYEPAWTVSAQFDRVAADDPLGGMIAADTATLLPDDFLVKVDRASMAHGLEVRPPLVDHELLELAAQIPSRYKVHRGETKWILKQAYQDRLPKGLLGRPKHGFEVPVDAWLRGPLHDMFESYVLDSNAVVSQFVDRAAIRPVYAAHRTGTAQRGAELWALLVLACWADRYLREARGEGRGAAGELQCSGCR